MFTIWDGALIPGLVAVKQQLGGFMYGQYGYANYFMAYALYPEIIEQGFKLQADTAKAHNRKQRDGRFHEIIFYGGF